MGGNSSLKSVVAGAGGQAALARMLGVRQATVWKWMQAGRVTLAYVEAVQGAARTLDPPISVTRAALAAIDEPGHCPSLPEEAA